MPATHTQHSSAVLFISRQEAPCCARNTAVQSCLYRDTRHPVVPATQQCSPVYIATRGALLCPQHSSAVLFRSRHEAPCCARNTAVQSCLYGDTRRPVMPATQQCSPVYIAILGALLCRNTAVQSCLYRDTRRPVVPATQQCSPVYIAIPSALLCPQHTDQTAAVCLPFRRQSPNYCGVQNRNRLATGRDFSL